MLGFIGVRRSVIANKKALAVSQSLYDQIKGVVPRAAYIHLVSSNAPFMGENP